MQQVIHELWDCQFISKFIIINIPSGDVHLCEKIKSESSTLLHNHSSWQRAVYGACVTFLSCVPESSQKYYSKVYILQILKEKCRIERYTYC